MSMLDAVLPVTTTALLGAAFTLLPNYISKRVEAAAAGAVNLAVGKQLEEHRAELAHRLENIRAAQAIERERFTRDYGLFAERRAAVYAETFSLLQKAVGMFCNQLGALHMRRDWSKAPPADLLEFAENVEHLSASERAEIEQSVAAGRVEHARSRANRLYECHGLREALHGFAAFRNAWALNALYYSTEVDEQLRRIAGQLASVSVDASWTLREEKYEANENLYTRLDELEVTASAVRLAMRKELQPEA